MSSGSRTVISKLPFAVFDRESLAVQFTVVVPIGKFDPDAGKQVTGTLPSTRSCALVLNATAAPEEFVGSSNMCCGSASAGGVVSTT